MIKPSSLWALFKRARNPLLVGRVAFAIAGRESELDRPLDDAEWALYSGIAEESKWMEEASDARRQKERERKAAYRARTVPPSQPVPRDTTGQDGTDACPAPSIHPSIHPSTQNNTSTNTESVPDTDRGVQGGRARARERARDVSGRDSGTRWWSIQDEEIRLSAVPVSAMLTEALGNGSWRKASIQVGGDPIRELFIAFRAEIRAGELPSNPAAAFTKRLEHDLGVDFSKSIDESREIGRANGATL